MADQKQVLKLVADRTKLIDSIIEEMENKVGNAQNDLLRRVAEDFVDKLDIDENGAIKNTLANKRKISLLDSVYADYLKTSGLEVMQTIVKNVSKILDFNGRYYSMFGGKADLGAIMTDTRETIGAWLGLDGKGVPIVNGYINTLVTDPAIKNQIRNDVFKSVISQKGYQEVKSDLKNYLAGNQGKAGALQGYYRNFVYDTFSQVDRTQSKIIADKLELQYAIYEGGIIKTTRPFCRARNGKVFTREEIAKFNPPTAKPPNYNPFTDMGGYACRHHYNWIPQALAFALRPELREAA